MKDFLTLIFYLFISFHAIGQSTFTGKVTDEDTGEPILFGDVILYQNGKLITGEQTDFDGNYIISPIDTGVYDVVFKYVGYMDLKYEGVLIKKDKETLLSVSIKPGIPLKNHVIVRSITIPIIEQDEFEKGQTFSSRDIRRMPNKN